MQDPACEAGQCLCLELSASAVRHKVSVSVQLCFEVIGQS
jgi:hypothetical protein